MTIDLLMLFFIHLLNLSQEYLDTIFAIVFFLFWAGLYLFVYTIILEVDE